MTGERSESSIGGAMVDALVRHFTEVEMEENYFSDKNIVDQSAAMIERKGGAKTNGISVVVACPNKNVEAVEILLEYDELKAALAELEADREALPYLYANV